MLVLSVATALSDLSDCRDNISDGIQESESDSSGDSNAFQESPSEQSTTDTRVVNEAPQRSPSSTNWLFQLYTELENQGISLPERLNEDELHRFYTAANGNFQCFLSSVKNTIRWRETYQILCGQELEMWSNLVFWHGSDVKNRPCLIIRLGLACTGLPSTDRPRIAQAIVSQVEHGVVHLVDSENPEIAVLVDCEGLPALRIPMQVLRSCTEILQDNFPDRLGCLFVIRLPPVIRVVTQTFIQVVKPVTRQKIKIEGGLYQKLLSEYLRSLPSYLGGTCTCARCTRNNINNMQTTTVVERYMQNTNPELTNLENNFPSLPPSPSPEFDMHVDNSNCDNFLRTAVIGVLMFWAFIAFMAGMYDPETRPSLPS